MSWSLVVEYRDSITSQRYPDFASAEKGFKNLIQFFFTDGYATQVSGDGYVVIRDEEGDEFARIRLLQEADDGSAI